ncbi:MAG: hypothetical protein O2782_11445 [bacterium]|nr:hypothetical protein [bacterium]
MNRKRVHQMLLALLVAAMLGWTACGDDSTDRVLQDTATQSGCIDCHVDQVALQRLAVEEELPEDTGEG